MKLAGTVAAALDEGGEFARRVKGFTPRRAQVEFAAAVAAAIEAGEPLVAEAGTGTGKTFGYLAPILLGGRRAVIATATRALQDQLFEHDLPLAARALGRPLRVAVLKGRTNYLCRARLNELETDLVGSAEFDIAAVRVWARATATGDLAEFPALGEGDAALRLLTVGADACQGSACPEFARCHVYAARRRAHDADMVIVNHHLLIADAAMKSEGGDLLGEAEVVVVDEAHALTDVARVSLGESVSSLQWADLADDARKFVATSDAATGSGGLERLSRSARALRGRVGVGRHAATELDAMLAPVLDDVRDALEDLSQTLDGAAEAAALVARARALALGLQRWQAESDDAGRFRWVEVRASGAFALHANPLEPGEVIGRWAGEGSASWIFSSATLAVAGRFDAMVRELGLDAPRTLLVESPFDYRRQARLYLPHNLPAVTDLGYTEAVLEAAQPLVDAAGGGCFFLFTSRQALRRAAELMRKREPRYPLFVQDEAPRARLLEQFRAAGNGVLLGTASFWEGVDVKGEALMLVVIDRLPFASPGDPMLRARLDRCREQGGNPFADIQLPEAVMTLKQGAGRLIRDAGDRGVLMLCDPRLQKRPYGRVFLRSLPPMPVAEDMAEAVRFLTEHASRGRACA